MHDQLDRHEQSLDAQTPIGAVSRAGEGEWLDDIVSQYLSICCLDAPDTSFLRNPHYHLETDTPDTLDYERMPQVTMGVAGGVRRIPG